MIESQIVQWVLESNAEGQWAVFLRAGGKPVQLSMWYPTRDAVLEAMHKAWTASVGLAWDQEPDRLDPTP